LSNLNKFKLVEFKKCFQFPIGFDEKQKTKIVVLKTIFLHKLQISNVKFPMNGDWWELQKSNWIKKC